MADSSLDDFFAKKDKNRKKQKSKGDGDDTTKQTKKEKKKKDREPGLGTNNILGSQEDDEWKDFEEEKKADYTGLRIQTLQIAAKEEQDKESGDCDDDGDDEDGENRGRKDGGGPWAKTNNSAASEASQVTAQPEPVKEPVAAASTPKGPGKYVPPAQRHSAMSSASSSHASHLGSARRKKEAPNMNSEEDFPTLGGGPTPGRAQSSDDYIDIPGQRKGVSLTLENKFSALQD